VSASDKDDKEKAAEQEAPDAQTVDSEPSTDTSEPDPKTPGDDTAPADEDVVYVTPPEKPGEEDAEESEDDDADRPTLDEDDGDPSTGAEPEPVTGDDGARLDLDGDDGTLPAGDAEPGAPEDPGPKEPVAPGHEEHEPVETAPEPVKTVEKVVEIDRRSGILPLILGGVLAGAAGYGIATYSGGIGASDIDPFQAEVRGELARQTDTLAALRDDLTALADRPMPEIPQIGDLVARTDAMSGSQAAMAETLATLDTRLTALDTRLTDLEKRPIAEGASEAAVAAYERELEALRTSLAAQREEIDEVISRQRAEIEAMAAEARESEQSAEELARQALVRAALGRVQAALDSGVPFDGALGDLAGAADSDIPAALADTAASGVPSMNALRESFPDAARSALAAARRADQDGGGGLGAFLQTQLGARSVTPREGSDPDAVLSRAEAALRDGRLTDALAEIDALPEVAKAELAEWAGQAETRQAALAAADALAAELNMN